MSQVGSQQPARTAGRFCPPGHTSNVAPSEAQSESSRENLPRKLASGCLPTGRGPERSRTSLASRRVSVVEEEPGSRPEVCYFFLRDGKCRYGDGCYRVHLPNANAKSGGLVGRFEVFDY